MAEGKRKILMIAPLPPPVHGSAMMTQYIKDSQLVNETVDMDWVNLSTSRRMDEIGRGSLAKCMRFAAAFLNTARKLVFRRYDRAYIAIACRGTGFLKDAPFALLCRLFRVPLIIHQHNRGMADYVDRPIYRTLLPKVYKGASVLLLSWHLYDDISRVVDRSQITICHNGIPDEASGAQSAPGTPVRLLFLSNLMAEKGVYVLLDALKLLKDQGCRFRCQFVGSETEEIPVSLLETEIRKRCLDDEVSYLGKRYGKEKEETFADNDVFVFPTSYDCFPLVLLEAMQHGLAVVTTDMGGNPDIIDDGVNGYIVRRDDPGDLALHIKQLIDNPELIGRFGREGRNKYSSSFTLRRFEENMVRILSSN